MEQTWRWFGPDDPVTLLDARQAGATGIVTALHDHYDGERAWSEQDVLTRKAQIETAGLRWSVVESIPVHNAIKTRTGDFARYTEIYCDSLRAVARCGVRTICYNFLPLVDWVRTDLRFPVASGGLALRFDMVDFVAYDVFILGRAGADQSYSSQLVKQAECRFAQMTPSRAVELERNIIAGLPGGTTNYSRKDLLAAFSLYATLTRVELHDNLVAFLHDIVPVAEEEGARLCIHPDDPPIPLFGLPRVTGNAEDIRHILNSIDSLANGLTFCVGSLGVDERNDLGAMAAEFGPRIHFAHLRNVKRESDGSFHEADHLDGSSNMVEVVHGLIQEEQRRRAEGRLDHVIPMRPDHGHLLLDDQRKQGLNAGYAAIGRLKGLAELRGVMRAIERLA